MCQSAGTVDGLNCLSYCCLFPSWYFQRCIKHLPHSPGRLHQSKPDLLHSYQLSVGFGVKYSSVTSSIFSASSLALLLLWCSLSLHRFLLYQNVHQLLVYLSFSSLYHLTCASVPDPCLSPRLSWNWQCFIDRRHGGPGLICLSSSRTSLLHFSLSLVMTTYSFPTPPETRPCVSWCATYKFLCSRFKYQRRAICVC